MRHRKAGRKLGRNATHRLALYRNLTMALIRHERIITTLEKAKAVRPFVEKLITLAKKGTLHARRLVIARLGPPAKAALKPDDKDNPDYRPVITKLFSEIGPRFKERPGGYTRIIKRHERRLGDADRKLQLDVIAVPAQMWIRPHVDVELEIAGNAARRRNDRGHVATRTDRGRGSIPASARSISRLATI